MPSPSVDCPFCNSRVPIRDDGTGECPNCHLVVNSQGRRTDEANNPKPQIKASRGARIQEAEEQGDPIKPQAPRELGRTPIIVGIVTAAVVAVAAVVFALVYFGGIAKNEIQKQKELEFAIRLVNEGLHEQALPHLDKFVAANPKSVEALRYRARARANVNQEAAAKADIDALLLLSPKDGEALFFWGTHLLLIAIDSRGRGVEEAESYLQRAVESDPENIRYRKQLQLAVDVKRRHQGK